MIKPSSENNWMTMISDPDEGSFFLAIIADSSNKASRLNYSQWLKEHSDPRWELLHLQALLSEHSKDRQEFTHYQSLYKQLRQQLSIFGKWLDYMETGLEAILNCSNKIPSPTDIFSYRCPNLWMQMQLTEDDTIRYCHQCSKNVYLCQTSQEVHYHAKHNHCISIPTKLCEHIAAESPTHMTGSVNLINLLEDRLFKKF